jgi:hypothetical protein
MEFKDKFQAVNVGSGIVIEFERTITNAFKGTWVEGNMKLWGEYSEAQLQSFVDSGVLFIRYEPVAVKTPESVIVDFMQFMEQQQGPLSDRTYRAIAQTIVVLNKVMYGQGEKNGL